MLLWEIVPERDRASTPSTRCSDKKELGDADRHSATASAARRRRCSSPIASAASGYTQRHPRRHPIAIKDMIIPKEKKEILEQRTRKSREIENQYLEGLITDGERYNKVIDIWAQVTEEVAEEMMEEISDEKVAGHVDGKTREAQAAVLQPDLHHGRLRRPRLARSRSASWPACAA